MPIRNEQGISLVDTMVAMALIAVGVVITMGVIMHSSQQRVEKNQLSSMLAIREHVQNVLARYVNFQATVHNAGNSTFDCLRLHQDCSSLPPDIANRNFVLWIKNNASATGTDIEYYNPLSTAPYRGFDQNGVICSSPNPTPNIDCQIRVDFSWTPICTTCNPAQISVEVRFSTYRNFMNDVVSRNYGFSMQKSVYDAGFLPPTWVLPP